MKFSIQIEIDTFDKKAIAAFIDDKAGPSRVQSKDARLATDAEVARVIKCAWEGYIDDLRADWID